MRRLFDDPLLRAWAALLALSLATTGLAALREAGIGAGLAGPVAGAAILALAWAKMRLILRRYLGLAAAPGIAAGFDAVLGAVAVLFYALFLIPEL